MLYDKRWEKKEKQLTVGAVLLAAADIIERNGWTYGTERDSRGRVCAMQAMRDVEGGWPTDAYLAAREVTDAYLGMSLVAWNDRRCWTGKQAAAKLREIARVQLWPTIP